MFSTAQKGMPLVLKYNEELWAKDGSFYEAVELCGPGDSINFSLTAYDFFISTFKSAVPDSLDGNDLLKFTVGVEGVMTTEEFMVLRTAKNLAVETKVIDNYLEKLGLTAQRTESGLTYIITQQGEGANAVAGDSVSVKYRGAFLNDKTFDEGVYSFPLGKGNVIKGWDEGIALLNPNSKATLLIPSSLAYGEAGMRGAIPPNAILKFDVELLSIVKKD